MRNIIFFLNMIGVNYYFSNSSNNALINNNIHQLSSRNNNQKLDNDTHSNVGNVDNNNSKLSTIIANSQELSSSKYYLELSSNVRSIINTVRKQVNDIYSLQELKQYVLDFQYCKLKLFSNNTVFSDGNHNTPQIMIIGEAPGEQEDIQAKPFCGRSGALLDKILFSINHSRESNVYITNTIFWRPPANRRPSQEEIEICKPIVEKHISLVMPRFILLTGNTAIRSLLAIDTQISKLQGNIIDYRNQYLKGPIYASAIFHPSYLLRQASQKKVTWKNMLKIQKFLKNSPI